MIADIKPLQSSPSFEINKIWPVARLWAIARIRSEKNRSDLILLSVFLGRGVIPYDEGGGRSINLVSTFQATKSYIPVISFSTISKLGVDRSECRVTWALSARHT